MKTNRRRHSVTAALLALAVFGSCHDDSNNVTGPGVRQPTPTPPPIANLTGGWSGWFSDSGATDDYFCPPRRQDVTAQIVQHGGDLSITLSSAGGCSHGGVTTFTGTMSGSALFGSLSTQGSEPFHPQQSCSLEGGAEGTASAQRLQLDGGMAGTCNRVHLHVELTREESP